MPMNTGHAVGSRKAEHQEAKALFDIYQALCDDEASGDQRQALAHEICEALTVHCQLEKQLFYCAVAKTIGNAALMDEAEVEQAKALIAQIVVMKPIAAPYDAKLKVLNGGFHLKEEHMRMFPLARKAGIDLLALGARLLKRRDELLAQQAAQAAVEDLAPQPEAQRPLLAGARVRHQVPANGLHRRWNREHLAAVPA